ncbi:hypothetical protein [Bradyrhizobium sp. ORS 111]|uniref:hypothetical protein n=1 Tax=Bradyrhizobium sp. ORS 111 TaxID=1685958 RepID=UPI00388E4A89
MYSHVAPVRQRWFGCACCPPNIARLFTSIAHYIYTPRADAFYINLYIGNSVALSVGGHTLRLLMSGNYPWKGAVLIAVESAQPIAHTLALRLPEWCSATQASLNGRMTSISGRKAPPGERWEIQPSLSNHHTGGPKWRSLKPLQHGWRFRPAQGPGRTRRRARCIPDGG